jgi:hypothetical protein
MSLATCLVTLNSKPLNLTKVAAMCYLQNFRLVVFFMLKALNAHQDIITYLLCRQANCKDVILDNLLASISALL